MCDCHTPPPPPDRRGFLARTAAVVIGGLITAVPALSGLFVLLDPLRRKGADGGFVKIATLDGIPADGVPRKFSVVADREDAWNKFPNTPVGAIYLRRTADRTVQALNVVCPHAGCFVEFVTERACYLCPCHNSTFATDGKINDPKSPSPRAMDDLRVELRGSEVWVEFRNYIPGHAEKVVKS